MSPRPSRRWGGRAWPAAFWPDRRGRASVRRCWTGPGGGIRPDFLTVPGETRTNLKLVEPGGELTELNDRGPHISQESLDALTAKLKAMPLPVRCLCWRAAWGPACRPEFYRDLTLRLKQKGAKVFVDADGPLFAHALEAVPDIIKPNAFELTQYFGLDHTPDEKELIGLGRTLAGRGVGLVCISRGGQGACFIQGDRVWNAPVIQVAVRSTVGAGDAMVAAIACGVDEGLPMEDCLRLAMAVSAGAVTTRGTCPPDLETVHALEARVRLSELAT